jgi:hypothetical protein
VRDFVAQKITPIETSTLTFHTADGGAQEVRGVSPMDIARELILLFRCLDRNVLTIDKDRDSRRHVE